MSSTSQTRSSLKYVWIEQLHRLLHGPDHACNEPAYDKCTPRRWYEGKSRFLKPSPFG